MDVAGISDAQLLMVAARALQRQAAAHLKTLRLPRTGLYILEYLDERSPMLHSEIARLILTSPQTIGAVLTRLEDERWVTRQRGLIIGLDALRPVLLYVVQRAAHPPHGTCHDH